jgi:hypothetical protein
VVRSPKRERRPVSLLTVLLEHGEVTRLLDVAIPGSVVRFQRGDQMGADRLLALPDVDGLLVSSSRELNERARTPLAMLTGERTDLVEVDLENQVRVSHQLAVLLEEVGDRDGHTSRGPVTTC